MTAATTTAPELLDELRQIRDRMGKHGDLFMRLNGFYRVGPDGPVEPEFGYRDFREFGLPTIQAEAAAALADLCRAPVAQDAEPVAWRYRNAERPSHWLNPTYSRRSYYGRIGMEEQALYAPQPSDEAATLRAQLAEAEKLAEKAEAERDESRAALAAAEDHADVLAASLEEFTFDNDSCEPHLRRARKALAAHQARRAGE